MRNLFRLHRLLALLIAAQVIIWVVSGFYFSWLGHTTLAGEKYGVASTPQFLNQPPAISVQSIAAAYPEAISIALHQVADTPQYSITLPTTELYIQANTGEPWSTSIAMARALAQANYAGPGVITTERQVDLATALPQQTGEGFAFTFADDEQTVIYVSADNGAIAGYGNRYSAITDWMFRLHFMDYSGQRDFNNLLNRSLGLIFLFFCSSGIVIIARQLASRRQQKKRSQQLTQQDA
ncbi:PepSY domain-containing protein [Pseudidiomarina aestuarii]|uniref:PepSY domain-containing protein n=1 Tax=Pseudidiomarina aestuarii TaxID=624146 RepID=UPI003A96FA27